MPEMQFDENGFPIWTNNPVGPDRSGTDPDPVSEAIAAISAIGQPGGIPLPGSLPEMGPGAVPVGEPPAELRANALINPANDALEYPPGPQPLNEPQPAVGTGMPAGFAPFDASQVVSGPSDAYAAGEITQAPAPIGSQRQPKLAKPGRVDPVTAANADVDASQAAAAQAVYDHGVASNVAQRELAERRAASAEAHAAQQAQADQQFQAARAAAQAQSEKETAQWMADMERKAKEEPNPKRWFASQSTASKVLWLMSLAFGTKAAMTAPGVQNIGLAMIKEELDKDMGEQKAQLAREMEVMRTRGSRLDKKQADRMAFLKDDHNIRTGQLLALEKAALERANAPGSADDQAAMAQAHSWLAQQRMGTAAQRAQQAFNAREAQLGRGHAAWMQRNSQQFQAEQNAIAAAERAAKDALDRMFKEQEAQSARAAKAAAQGANTFTIGRDSGIQLVTGGKSAPLSINTEGAAGQKRAEQVTTLSNAAQEVTAELRIIQDAIKDGSFLERLTGSDANLQAAVTRLGYSKAKENDPRGIVTNADFTAGLVSAMGAKYDTATGRFMYELKQHIGGKDPSAALAKSIDKELAIVESRTNAKLNSFVPLEERGGGSIVWRAQNRNPAEAQTETLDQREARIRGDLPSDQDGPKPIRSQADLKSATEAAKAGATDALPHYQRSADGDSNAKYVATAREEFKALSPEKIDSFAEGLLTRVQGDARAMYEIEHEATVAKKAAEAREDRVRAALTVLSASEKRAPTRLEVARELERHQLSKMVEEEAYVTEVLEAVKAVAPFAKLDKGKK